MLAHGAQRVLEVRRLERPLAGVQGEWLMGLCALVPACYVGLILSIAQQLEDRTWCAVRTGAAAAAAPCGRHAG